MRLSKLSGRFRFVLGAWLFVAAVVLSAPYAVASDAPADAPSGAFLDTVMEGAGWLGVIIGLLSLFAAMLIFEHFFSIRRSTMITEEEVKSTREMVERRQFKECIEKLSKSKTMFGDVLTVGLRHGRHGFEAMQEAVEERAMAWRSSKFRRVEYLNIIGNISPLLGLLGTVIGMIDAFGKMRTGAYGADNLAGGISTALVSTFLGLIVAIMAMFFFGICRNRVDSLTVAAHAAAVDILEYFRPAQFTPGPSGASSSPFPASAGGTSPSAPVPGLPGAAPPARPPGPATTSGPVQLAEG